MEKLQTVIIFAAVVSGLLLGQHPYIENTADIFIAPLLLLMLYGIFLAVPLHDLRNAFKHRRFFQTSIFINFIWTPILAWVLGALFLAEHPTLWIGFIMLLVTPCTDWYLLFTRAARGNLVLSTSILPLNLILQVLLLPVYLLIFAGTFETISQTALFESIFYVLFLPMGAALATRFFLKKRQKVLYSNVLPFFQKSQILFLAGAVTAMFASQGAVLLDNPAVILLLFLPLMLFFIINFVVGLTAARLLSFTYENSASLQLTITARNSPVALAVALTAFPDQPLTALALVIGPLLELPVLALISQILLFRRRQTANHLTRTIL